MRRLLALRFLMLLSIWALKKEKPVIEIENIKVA
jgi:hypothetical protein